MSFYIPGHSAILAYALEVGSITESADGTAPATLPAIPGSPILIGYTNVPEATRDLGNAKGFAIGSPFPLYNKRGVYKPSVSFEMRLGSIPLLQRCLRNSSNDLDQICLYVGVAGQPCKVYRFAKCGEFSLNLQEGDSQELTASTRFEAITTQVGPTLSPTLNQLKAPGVPLHWHDVRQFNIPVAGTLTDFRRTFMGCRATINHNIERKAPRPNWGDAEPLSRTSSELLPHFNTASGDMTLHKELPEALFNAAADSQDWGNIVIPISDGPGLVSGGTTKIFNLTMQNVLPQVATQAGVDASAQMQHRLTYAFDNLVIATS